MKLSGNLADFPFADAKKGTLQVDIKGQGVTLDYADQWPPLAELEGYSARLKSVTGGHGSWSMQLSHYEQAPPNLQQQLVVEYKKSRKHEDE